MLSWLALPKGTWGQLPISKAVRFLFKQPGRPCQNDSLRPARNLLPQSKKESSIEVCTTS